MWDEGTRRPVTEIFVVRKKLRWRLSIELPVVSEIFFIFFIFAGEPVIPPFPTPPASPLPPHLVQRGL